jgi:CRP-like cAMP-binding protein
MSSSGQQTVTAPAGRDLPPVGIFAALSAAEWAAVSTHFTERQVPCGQDLWTVGEAADYLLCVVAGRVEVKIDTEFPGKQLVVGVFSAGAVIGASALLDHLPRSTAAGTLEPVTLLRLTRDGFAALIDENPRIGIKLLKGMLLAEAARLRQAYSRLASVF